MSRDIRGRLSRLERGAKVPRASWWDCLADPNALEALDPDTRAWLERELAEAGAAASRPCPIEERIARAVLPTADGAGAAATNDALTLPPSTNGEDDGRSATRT